MFLIDCYLIISLLDFFLKLPKIKKKYDLFIRQIISLMFYRIILKLYNKSKFFS